MKLWAIKKTDCAEYTVGLDVEGADFEKAKETLYLMARNLFNGSLELLWQKGESGEAFSFAFDE